MKIDKKIFDIIITKSSKKGGQNVNKVETNATVIHRETGLKETCQDTRSKIQNIELAYERLIKRIEKIVADEKHEKLNDKRNEVLVTQGVIRTYNYNRNEVKDHRTGKVANLKRVLDGKLDEIW